MKQLNILYAMATVLFTLVACTAPRQTGPVPGSIEPPTPASLAPTVAPSPDADNPLAGTTWELTELRQHSTLPGTMVSLEVSADRLNGNGGCNSYGGEYTINGTQLKIGAVVATEMGCTTPEGILDQESAYFATLNEVASFTLQGNQLRLLNSAGEAILVYQKKAG